MLGINMFGIFAGINVHSGRLNSSKAGINKFNVFIDFNIMFFFIFLWENIVIFYGTMCIKIWGNTQLRGFLNSRSFIVFFKTGEKNRKIKKIPNNIR
jgi:hypothetical protein